MPKNSWSRYAALFYEDMQSWPQDFRQNCYYQWNSWNIFLLAVLGKVLFPWWSSPQPCILSKVMQLRLLLRRKHSFCFLCCHILCTHTQAAAAAAPALCSAISRSRQHLDIWELHTTGAAVFHTVQLNTFDTGWWERLSGLTALCPWAVCTGTVHGTLAVCEIHFSWKRRSLQGIVALLTPAKKKKEKKREREN